MYMYIYIKYIYITYIHIALKHNLIKHNLTVETMTIVYRFGFFSAIPTQILLSRAAPSKAPDTGSLLLETED